MLSVLLLCAIQVSTTFGANVTTDATSPITQSKGISKMKRSVSEQLPTTKIPGEIDAGNSTGTYQNNNTVGPINVVYDYSHNIRTVDAFGFLLIMIGFIVFSILFCGCSILCLRFYYSKEAEREIARELKVLQHENTRLANKRATFKYDQVVKVPASREKGVIASRDPVAASKEPSGVPQKNTSHQFGFPRHSSQKPSTVPNAQNGRKPLDN